MFFFSRFFIVLSIHSIVGKLNLCLYYFVVSPESFSPPFFFREYFNYIDGIRKYIYRNGDLTAVDYMTALLKLSVKFKIE